MKNILIFVLSLASFCTIQAQFTITIDGPSSFNNTFGLSDSIKVTIIRQDTVNRYGCLRCIERVFTYNNKTWALPTIWGFNTNSESLEFAFMEYEEDTLRGNDFTDLYYSFFQFPDIRNPIFNNGGAIQLQYRLNFVRKNGLLDTTLIYSNMLTIQVPPINNLDRQSFDYLYNMRDSFPRFALLTQFRSMEPNYKYLPYLKTCYQQFPGSILAPCSKYQYVLAHCSEKYDMQIIDEMRGHLSELKNSSIVGIRYFINVLRPYNCLSW